MAGFFYHQRELAHCQKDAHPREYSVWTHMHKRRKHRDYVIVDSWKVFAKFLEDVGPVPNENYYLKIIDKARPYGPGNCQWEPLSQQQLQDRKRQQKQKVKKSLRQCLGLNRGVRLK